MAVTIVTPGLKESLGGPGDSGDTPPDGFAFLVTGDGDFVVTEDGDRILVEI